MKNLKRLIPVFLLLFLSSSVYADDLQDNKATTEHTPLLDGEWTVKEFRAAGAYTGGAEQEALEAMGKSVKFDSGDAWLYDGQHCAIHSTEQIEIDDFGFGSAGGSWTEIGIKPVSGKDNHYRVKEIILKCKKEYQDTRSLWIANDGDLILLSVWETWVQLEKVETSDIDGPHDKVTEKGQTYLFICNKAEYYDKASKKGPMEVMASSSVTISADQKKAELLLGSKTNKLIGTRTNHDMDLTIENTDGEYIFTGVEDTGNENTDIYFSYYTDKKELLASYPDVVIKFKDCTDMGKK